MEEEATSWIRRTKFSHTVCHRIDPSKMASLPLTILPNTKSGLKTRPKPIAPNLRTESNVVQTIRDPSKNKQRAVSPQPEIKLSDTFKEARSNQKRFSTPNPRRKSQDKGLLSKPLHKDFQESKASRSGSSLRHFNSMKFYDRPKSNKDSVWTKLFDYGGGRVTSVETADEHMPDLSELTIGYKFAHGAHSQLYGGTYKGESVALKIIRVLDDDNDDDENRELGARLEKYFTREVTLLSRLQHQNIIKFVAAFRQPSVFCIITEFLEEGSLRAYLHRLENKPLPLQKLISMALDIARGMEYIHSRGVIHRDLKPENILITSDLHLKVADFGIACEEVHCDQLADDPGTYRWMAPEMIKRKPYGRKVDVYGFGLILWELVAGVIPYEDMTPIQAAFAVLNKDLRPEVPRDCPLAMKALIEQCWSVQPEKRPDFWQIVKVLEEFDTSLARDGTISLELNPFNQESQDHKRGLRHWIQKLGPSHQSSSSMPKPKFT